MRNFAPTPALDILFEAIPYPSHADLFHAAMSDSDGNAIYAEAVADAFENEQLLEQQAEIDAVADAFENEQLLEQQAEIDAEYAWLRVAEQTTAEDRMFEDYERDLGLMEPDDYSRHYGGDFEIEDHR